MPFASGLVVGVVLAAAQLPWEVAVLSEGRGFEGGGDLQVVPRAVLGYEERELLVHLRYEPQLLLRTPSSRGRFADVQGGALDGALRIDRDMQLRLAQTASVGSFSLAWLASTPDTPPSSVVRDARSATVDMLNLGSSLALDAAITNRVRVSTEARYSVAGGYREGLATLPRTSTADLHASGSWVERRDAFSIAVGGGRGWVSTSDTNWQVDASAVWRHALSAASEHALTGEPPTRIGDRPQPRYETELTAGMAVLGGSAVEHRGVVPTATVAIRRDEPTRRPGAFGARVLLRYAPTIDLTTGSLLPRYEGSLLADVRLALPLSAFCGAGVGITPNPAPPETEVLAQAGLGLSYEPFLGLSIAPALRMAKLAAVEWGAVVTVTATQRGRF